MGTPDIAAIQLGLNHFKCANCGKEFYTRALKDEYAYTSRNFKPGEPEMYCSWHCLREAEKSMPEVRGVAYNSRSRGQAKHTRTTYVRGLTFGALVAKPGVWRNARQSPPKRKCVVAVKAFSPRSHTLTPKVAEFTPAGQMRRTRSEAEAYTPVNVWQSTNTTPREFHNVVEWYDTESTEDDLR